ncbi:MAG: 4-hydroxy-tetrahydrodipicolinate reductase [Candidatus Tantalella remota]|nr:4-hydroxy-tetrahydrodipicolinate reductase [Candidatus Tantalella remota]
MIKIGIAGACGKMGKRIADLAFQDADVEISAAFEHPDNPDVGGDIGTIAGSKAVGVAVSSDADKACADSECIIDFTLPEPTLEHLKACVASETPMVIGTTGIDAEGEKVIAEASEKIPVVFSPNMAPGVNLVFKMVAEAARTLGSDFTIKVDETHHVHKKDSPSGTAKMIGKVIKDSCGSEPTIEAFREGEVIGNHGIVFDGEFENIEIRHDAKTRDVFAAGAIKAAKFAAKQKPGLYSMADVLGL